MVVDDARALGAKEQHHVQERPKQRQHDGQVIVDALNKHLRLDDDLDDNDEVEHEAKLVPCIGLSRRQREVDGALGGLGGLNSR